MIKTKKLDDPTPVPYVAKYGPRYGLRSASRTTSVVDFSFLRPRKGIDLTKVQEITPKYLADMKYFIRHGL